MDNHFTPKEIKSLRNSLKLTQSQFARKLKIDVITVSRWERGTQRPSQLAMRQLHRLHEKVEEEGNHPKGVNDNISTNSNG